MVEKGKIGGNRLHFAEIGSTNTYLKENGDKLPHGTAVLADRQTAGRGRLGRSWEDSGSDALKFSVLIKGLGTDKLPLLPAVTGVAVCSSLISLFGEGFLIKWPNDIVYNGKKICGILCESRVGQSSLQGSGGFAVCGIGINLSQPQSFFDSCQLPHAGSVETTTGVKPEAAVVYEEVIRYFEKDFNIFCREGFSPLLEEYKRRSATLGKEVLVLADSREQRGKALELGADGQLICLIDGQKVEITSGEASVRGLYGM